MSELDLFVIGGGSGGVRAARIAAQHGAKVAIAEEQRWGGTCVVRGCVPKKLLVYGSAVRAQLEDARAFGWTIEGARVDWPTLRDAVQREVTRLSSIYAANLDKRAVERIDARARLVEPGLVDVGGRRVRARHVLVATGGAPRRPHIPGCEKMLTSDDVFTLERLPGTLMVVGAGYIGLEMAHIFAGLGVRVILAHHGPLPLRGFDLDVRTLAAASLKSRGIEIHSNCQPTAVEDVAGGRLRVHLSACAPIEVDAVLAATGRLPQSHGIGLEELGVAMDAHGGITVDEYARTNVAGVYAVGDVTGRLALTPIAIREGHAFADTVFGDRPTPFVPEGVATAVFAQPAIATVGLSEELARERGLEITIHKSEFRPLKHTVSGRDERVLIKVICDAATRRVLGLHLVGDDAPEIIQAAAIAITMGCTKDDLDRTVAVHPTAAEELVLLG
jgi:glutathione reductase (NADPH)